MMKHMFSFFTIINSSEHEVLKFKDQSILSVIVVCLQQFALIDNSYNIDPILTKLHRNVPWVTIYQNCLNKYLIHKKTWLPVKENIKNSLRPVIRIQNINWLKYALDDRQNSYVMNLVSQKTCSK